LVGTTHEDDALRRLILHLPESLRELLANRAERAGMSLNEYMVVSLMRAVTATDVVAQRELFDRLTHRCPAEEAEVALSEVLAERS
jgi:uncharacterized protein (DUF1778 family)